MSTNVLNADNTCKAQFYHLFDTCRSLFQTLWEKTEDIFQKVIVVKTDERGQIKTYPQTGVIASTSQIPYVVDLRTQNLYLDEEFYVLSLKCAALVLTLPLYTCLKMLWHGVKAVETQQMAHAYEIVKAPFFGLGMGLAAFCGVFRPHQGSVAAGGIEYVWQNGASYKNVGQRAAAPNESYLRMIWEDIKIFQPMFIGRCLQARGNLNDTRIQVVKRRPI